MNNRLLLVLFILVMPFAMILMPLIVILVILGGLFLEIVGWFKMSKANNHHVQPSG